SSDGTSWSNAGHMTGVFTVDTPNRVDNFNDIFYVPVALEVLSGSTTSGSWGSYVSWAAGDFLIDEPTIIQISGSKMFLGGVEDIGSENACNIIRSDNKSLSEIFLQITASIDSVRLM